MPRPDYQRFFEGYASQYEKALGRQGNFRQIRDYFAESFVAADVNGEVVVGKNDDSFDQTLRKGYEFYRAIGTRRMQVERVEAVPLYEDHDRVRVSYRAEYRRRDGESLEIPFDLVYLLQRRADGPKIFGYIAGDEMGLYRRHGLVDDQDRPLAD